MLKATMNEMNVAERHAPSAIQYIPPIMNYIHVGRAMRDMFHFL